MKLRSFFQRSCLGAALTLALCGAACPAQEKEAAKPAAAREPAPVGPLGQKGDEPLLPSPLAFRIAFSNFKGPFSVLPPKPNAHETPLILAKMPALSECVSRTVTPSGIRLYLDQWIGSRCTITRSREPFFSSRRR